MEDDEIEMDYGLHEVQRMVHKQAAAWNPQGGVWNMTHGEKPAAMYTSASTIAPTITSNS